MAWKPKERAENLKLWEAWTHDYHTKYIAIAVEVLKNGGTAAEVAGKIGVTRRTIERWLEKGGEQFKPDFAKAYQEAWDYAEGEFNRLGLERLKEGESKDSKFNAVLYQMIARRRYHWSEQPKVKIEGIDKCANHTERSKLLLEALAIGTLSAQEHGILSKVLVDIAHLEDFDKMKLEIEQIKESVKNNG